MDVVVTGIGLRCSLGSLTESWHNLLEGKSRIKIEGLFRELPPYPLGLIGQTPISLTDLTQQTVADALADARLEPPLPECGVVIGSSRGCQPQWEEFARRWRQGLPSPPLANALPHQGAIAVAHQIGCQGPMLAPMAACGTGIWGIAQGAELIRQGKCQRVLAGAVEAPISPLTLTGFQQMGALAKTGCYPFDRRREGLVLGEGGAVLVLESRELAVSRGAAIYGQVLGWGLTCDAYHISAPPPDDRSGIIAIKQCLERSHLLPPEVDYLHPHGTGTLQGDRREAQLIGSLFPEAIPVSSTKGATAHTLGAAGAIAVAFCLMGLKHQQLPPCVGLQEPDFPLNFLMTARQQEVRHILCFSFGFGGQNGAIGLGSADL